MQAEMSANTSEQSRRCGLLQAAADARAGVPIRKSPLQLGYRIAEQWALHKDLCECTPYTGPGADHRQQLHAILKAPCTCGRGVMHRKQLPGHNKRSAKIEASDWVVYEFHMLRERLYQKVFTGSAVAKIEGSVENVHEVEGGNHHSFAIINVDTCREKSRHSASRSVYVKPCKSRNTQPIASSN